MKSNILLKLASLISIGLILTGCVVNLSPIEVSERFWTAVQDKDQRAIRKYVSSSTLEKDDLTEDILPLDEISLGRTVIDGEQAWVDTEVIISGDNPFNLPIKTVLLRENKQWKVDYDAPMHSISRGSSVARVLGSIANLSEKFSNELNRSLDEIQKIIPEVEEEIGKIEENVRKKLPELRKRIEEILQQLEEALGNIGNKKESSGTTEI